MVQGSLGTFELDLFIFTWELMRPGSYKECIESNDSELPGNLRGFSKSVPSYNKTA